MSANDFLMQFQSDVLGIDVDRPIEKESTALGAVYLCGMGLKLFNKENLSDYRKTERVFSPSFDKKYEEYYNGWKKAIERSEV